MVASGRRDIRAVLCWDTVGSHCNTGSTVVEKPAALWLSVAGSHNARLDVRVLVEVVSWEVSYDDRVEVAKMTEWAWIRGLARSTE